MVKHNCCILRLDATAAAVVFALRKATKESCGALHVHDKM